MSATVRSGAPRVGTFGDRKWGVSAILDNPPAELLDEVAMAIENGGLIRRLPAGSQLLRARQHAPEVTLTTPAQLGSPPPAAAAANRMSPPGISMFYGAEASQTALAELRPEASPCAATVGTWATARSLRYLDLVDVEVPSIFDVVGASQRPWLLFLRGFATDVSRPTTPGGGAVDYVPTQVVTEYVRHVLGDPDDPVRGIRYRSAVSGGGLLGPLRRRRGLHRDQSRLAGGLAALAGLVPLLAASLPVDAHMDGDPVSEAEGLPILRPEVLPAGFLRALEHDAGQMTTRSPRKSAGSPSGPALPTPAAPTGRTWRTSPAGASRRPAARCPPAPPPSAPT